MSDDLKYMEERKIIPNTRLIEVARRDEGRFLTLVLRNESLMQDAINSKVSFKHFLIEQNAHFYGFIVDFFRHHGVLPTEQTFRSRLETIITDDMAISSQVVTFQNVYHAFVEEEEYGPLKEGLINRFVQQQVYEVTDGGQRLVDMIGAMDSQVPALTSLLNDLSQINTGIEADTHTRVSSANESVDRLLDAFDERIANPEIAYGLMTNFESIDSRFLGFEPGKYLIIVGPPHGCKTTLMLNLAYGMAKKGKVVVFVTMESTDDEIMERLIALESGVPSIEIKDGNKLKDPVRNSKVREAAERVKRMVGEKLILISVPQNTKWSKIKGLIEAERRIRNVDAFWVDYLDVIAREVQIDGHPDLELGDLSVRIQAYAKSTSMFGATAQSLNNEKIRELKKKNVFEKPEEAAALAGGEGVGGSQKLWRDADYMLTSLPFKKGKRITIVITKARKDGSSEDVFYFGWEPMTGLVHEYQSTYFVIDSVQDLCKGMALDEPPEIEIEEVSRIVEEEVEGEDGKMIKKQKSVLIKKMKTDSESDPEQDVEPESEPEEQPQAVVAVTESDEVDMAGMLFEET